MAYFKERLEEALAKAGLNKAELAKKSGLNRGMITQWVQGKAMPKIENVRKLAEVLGCDPNWLRGEDIDSGETKLVMDYRKLNDIGKDKANEYVEDLTFNEKYKKAYSNLLSKKGVA